MRSAAGSSRTSTATAAAEMIRCIGSATCCVPGKEHLTNRQKTRLETAFTIDDRHVEVEVAWHCAQQLRSVYHQSSHADGRRVAEKILASFPSCPIPEIARLGRTLNRWRDAFLGYFTTGRANNGGTEAICESGFGWSGTGWSGWRRSCRPGCDSRSNWPACGVFPLNCPLGSARSAPFGPPR